MTLLCLHASVWRMRLRYGRMVKALACRVEGPGFKSHHGKKFWKKKFQLLSKKKKKKKGQLSSACMMEVRMTECSPTRKKAGVCAIMSM